MDYAEYVSRRPPSPPSVSARDQPFIASPSLSSTLSTLSASTARLSLSAAPDRPRRRPSPRYVSSLLHRRAVRDEYASLAHLVRAASPADVHRTRQEIVRIRLEDMLTRADPTALRVLHLALDKCNARLDALAADARRVEEARERMRVIESKHFHGADSDVHVPQALREQHIRREAVATLVEHIQCTLHDQVRIHFMLTVLAEKLSLLRSHLHALDRADRPSPEQHMQRGHAPLAAASPDPNHQGSGLPRSRSTQDPSKLAPFSRRSSRSSLRHIADVDGPEYSQDRPTSRNNTLRSQRSLPRRSDTRLIPKVVKRALSYNAAPPSSLDLPPSELPRAPSALPVADTSWWGDTVPVPGRVDGRLSMSETRRSSGLSTVTPPHSRRAGVTATLAQRVRLEDIDQIEDEVLPPMSPMSHVSRCTTPSDVSRSMDARRGAGRGGAGEYDQSVLVDIDSLCTEASSVLSSSQGIDAPVECGAKRGLVGGMMVRPGGYADSKRGRALSRLRLGRMRMPSQIKKLWVEINELYATVLTHGPHLVEEKIVPSGSVGVGILGGWNARRVKAASLHASFQASAVVEGLRKVEGIVLWQQRLIVAIRRDLVEQRRALYAADFVISQAYLQTLDAQQEGR